MGEGQVGAPEEARPDGAFQTFTLDELQAASTERLVRVRMLLQELAVLIVEESVRAAFAPTEVLVGGLGTPPICLVGELPLRSRPTSETSSWWHAPGTQGCTWRASASPRPPPEDSAPLLLLPRGREGSSSKVNAGGACGSRCTKRTGVLQKRTTKRLAGRPGSPLREGRSLR